MDSKWTAGSVPTTPETLVTDGLDLPRSWELNQRSSYLWRSFDDRLYRVPSGVVVTRDYETDTIVAIPASDATVPSSGIRELDFEGCGDVVAPTEVGRKLDFNDGRA